MGKDAEVIRARFRPSIAVTGPHQYEEAWRGPEAAQPGRHASSTCPRAGRSCPAPIQLFENSRAATTAAPLHHPLAAGDLVTPPRRHPREPKARRRGHQELLVIARTPRLWVDLRHGHGTWKAAKSRPHDRPGPRTGHSGLVRLRLLYPYPQAPVIPLMAEGGPHLTDIPFRTPPQRSAREAPRRMTRGCCSASRWRAIAPTSHRSRSCRFPGRPRDFNTFFLTARDRPVDRVGAFASSLSGRRRQCAPEPVPEEVSRSVSSALWNVRGISTAKSTTRRSPWKCSSIRRQGTGSVRRSKADAPEIDGEVHPASGIWACESSRRASRQRRERPVRRSVGPGDG